MKPPSHPMTILGADAAWCPYRCRVRGHLVPRSMNAMTVGDTAWARSRRRPQPALVRQYRWVGAAVRVLRGGHFRSGLAAQGMPGREEIFSLRGRGG